MSVQDYTSALKLGKRAYNSAMNRGKSPYLPVLENFLDEETIDREVNLGEDQIPLSLVVGTCTAARTNAFAENFMPLLDWGTEFAAKWASLSDSQVNEGIREPIKVYEYMNKFYVLEGNKRVSVLKYFGAVTVNAKVIRKIPKYDPKNVNVKIYYEFMDFYKATKINDIYFSKEGSFISLMNLAGIKKDEALNESAVRDMCSAYYNFKVAYLARGGNEFDYPIGDSFLRFVHIHGYENVVKMIPSEMSKNVAKTWAEFELLDDNSEVNFNLAPSNKARKNILSYLLPFGSTQTKKLKVGFIYEKSPSDSDWVYAHELGRQYIEETFGSQIETITMDNVIPDVNDEKCMKKMVKDGVDIIFVTSPSMTIASLKVAIANPKVKILNCSLKIPHKYIRTYYARMYEAKFLSGIIAGSMAESGRIGYVANCPIFGVTANINAFALGARMVNPRVKVYVEWSGIKDNDVEANFANNGVHCISDQDMITPIKGKRNFGLYCNGEGYNAHFAMTIWHWGVFYEKLIQSIISGSWEREDEDDNSVKALNYWWGLSAGVVEIIESNAIPKTTKKLVNVLMDRIIKNDFNIFEGELIDQNGRVRNKEGNILTPEEIISMDYLLDNVVGSFPDVESLNDSAKRMVANQGVIKMDKEFQAKLSRRLKEKIIKKRGQ